MLHPGEIVAGKYRIERLLAQGGMGAVFVAEHLDTERHVALKVLHPKILTSAEAVRRFQVEAKLAARIGSTHIVDVVDSGIDEARRAPFLVMELLRGETVEVLVSRAGPLPHEVAILLLRQAASALDKAHAYIDKAGVMQPIVHRDLKPENLFVTRRESGEYWLKILDFGLAKVLSDGTAVTTDVRGTPLYMAYEQAAGAPITPRTDIWALGLIAFFMLAGRPYWRAAADEDATTQSLFGEILALPIDPPTARLAEAGLRAPWPHAFDAWFARCVARDPRERFTRAGEAVEGLAAVLGCAPSRGSSEPGASAAEARTAVATEARTAIAAEPLPATSCDPSLPATSRDPSLLGARSRSLRPDGGALSTGGRQSLGDSAPYRVKTEVPWGALGILGAGAVGVLAVAVYVALGRGGAASRQSAAAASDRGPSPASSRGNRASPPPPSSIDPMVTPASGAPSAPPPPATTSPRPRPTTPRATTPPPTAEPTTPDDSFDRPR